MHTCSVASVMLTFWDPMDCSPPGCSVHGIHQARILEWFVMHYSRGSSRPRDQNHNFWVSSIGSWILYPLSHLGSLNNSNQFSSVAQSCPTLCDPMNRSMPGLPVHHHLLEFTQTHAIESVMPSSHLILCRPLLLLPQSLPASKSFPTSQLFT